MKQCPTCKKKVQWQDNPFRPFCSERCQLVDLGKWVSEEYRVPGKPLSQESLTEDEKQTGLDSNSSSGSSR
jgi:endogenous inhibitor of DNA gyrase (YacG/DUF329 family)